MSTKLLKTLLVIAFIISLTPLGWSAPTPETGVQERSQELLEKEKTLRKEIEKEKPKPQIQEEAAPEKAAPPEAPPQKVLVQKINIIGATLLPAPDINKIILQYENKELTLAEMQKIADLITDAYRQKGYITSRAYLPPQKIEGGVLEIRVLEGTMGDLQIKGNRFFRTKLLAGKITLKRGEPFNYNILRKNMVKINEHPDRSCRAVFMPGKEPGTTDVVLEVKDRLPLHASFSWDNFGSRYIEKQRYLMEFTDNNLLGFDDKLTFQYQMAQSSRYFLKNIRYLFPAGSTTEVGAYAAFSRLKLGEEFEDQDVRGKSILYGLFANKMLIDTETLDLRLTFGFDYKNITNFQLQRAVSEDRLRIIKGGFDADMTDSFGRTLLIYDLDLGIPDIMGGLDAKDPQASRAGAGGKFVKHNLYFLRLQKMPFSTSLLWKNQFQFSPYILPSSEQFQLGGIINVRGYPPAEKIGDQGYATTFEWSVPPYFIPKNIKVPYSQAKLYDALRFEAFYDLGTVYLKRPLDTEKKRTTLQSLGCGIRFNLPEDLSLRLEFAWPVGKTPSDSDSMHTWVQISKGF